MPSSGLKSFVQAFHSGATNSRALTSLPVFLAPGTLQICRPPPPLPRRPSPRVFRKFASVNSPQVPNSDTITYANLRPQVQSDSLDDLSETRQQRDPVAWALVLDRYLPQPLRLQEKSPILAPERGDPLPAMDIPLVLDKARKSAKVDLLSYVGVFQERWEAVFWLVKEMLQDCPPFSTLLRQSEQLPAILWQMQGRTLDEVSGVQITVKDAVPSKITLHNLLGHEPFGGGHTDLSPMRLTLGQLWQSLGCMILQAEDLSANNPNREVIMAHVLQILAHMHHIGALPDSIYNYDPPEDETVLRRPPTLYLLSARIMTVLSDVAWKSHWVGEMEQAQLHGYELPPPRIQPQLPNVGSEIWLELVLWACVQGGWITEGAWLIAEIQRRRLNPSLSWSTINWDEICAVKKPQLDWTAILKLQIDRARLNHSTGIGIAGSGTSSVEMGTRTVSREVVLAIMDGLVNTTSTDENLQRHSFMQVQDYVSNCKDLLESQQPSLKPGHLNALILRSMESSMADIKSEPGYLQILLRLAFRKSCSRALPEEDSSVLNSSVLDFSAAILGLLQNNLHTFARQTNLRGSLQALGRIQDVIDVNRDTYIREFADELRERLQSGNDSVEPTGGRQGRSVPMLYPEMPPYVVDAFLDLITETRNFDLGRWLLFNDDIDGGIMSPNLFAEPTIQPALLRFATATADDELVMRVLENLEMPLSQTILHALLRCQVALNKWNAVEGILERFRDESGMAWSAIDAVTIAAAIMHMEWADDGAHMVDLLQAKGILQDLVHGVYNSPRNQAQVPDLLQFQTANQLGRIFQSFSGALSLIKLGPQGYLGRAAYSTIIPSDAFIILLDTIVAHHGPSAGIKMWEQWCLNPSPSAPDERRPVFDSEDGSEKVVRPIPSMLRSILRPVTEDLKTAIQAEKIFCEGDRASEISGDHEFRNLVSKESLSVLDWTMDMYGRFGFSNEDVLGEVPVAPSLLRRFMKGKLEMPSSPLAGWKDSN